MRASGTYYNGKTSAGLKADLVAEESALTVTGAGFTRRDPLSLVRIDAPLGTSRRAIRFDDGAVCEVIDNLFLDRLLDLQGSGGMMRHLHQWERSLKLAITALVLLVVSIAAFIRWGVPLLAEQASRAMPLHAEQMLGRQTLEALDKILLKKSKLSGDRRQEIDKLFADVVKTAGDARTYRLEFRSAEKIGPNAFALPGGIVIITDALVDLARNDNEVAAVLAHEVGHIRHRHAIRHMLQNSATTLLIASITGDITSITSLSATLPTLLIDAKYSRDFERDADDAAIEYLKSKGERPRLYAEMLARLDAEVRTRSGQKNKAGLPDILSTHPETEDRIKRIMSASQRSPSQATDIPGKR